MRVFYILFEGGIAAVTIQKQSVLVSWGWAACGHIAALLLCWAAEALIPLCAIAEPTMRQEKSPSQRAWHFLWSVKQFLQGNLCRGERKMLLFLSVWDLF